MTNKKLDNISAIFCVLLLVAIFCIGMSIVDAVGGEGVIVSDYISSVCLILTAIFGIYYTIVGCKKVGGAKYYVWYMGALAVCDLIAIAGAVNYPAVGTLALALSIACCTVLCFAKDLGQKKSTGFAVVALLAKVVVLFITLIVRRTFSMLICASVLLAVVALFMVCAKYYDKSTRGSK